MSKQRKPQTLTIKDSEGAKCCNGYEYSMALVNISTKSNGVTSSFNAGPRDLPTNKIVGEFEHKGIKYHELVKRKYILCAGLEQVVAFILEAKNDKKLCKYFSSVLGWKNKEFLDWVLNFKYKGDIFAVREGTVTFGYEPLMRLQHSFEEIQVFESIILSLLGRESMVATAAHDVAKEAIGKTFFEGSSHRADGPEDALRVARSAKIGGFNYSSFINPI